MNLDDISALEEGSKTLSFNIHRIHKHFFEHPYSSSSNNLCIYLRSEGGQKERGEMILTTK
jgi:hypothetical protein